MTSSEWTLIGDHLSLLLHVLDNSENLSNRFYFLQDEIAFEQKNSPQWILSSYKNSSVKGAPQSEVGRIDLFLNSRKRQVFYNRSDRNAERANNPAGISEGVWNKWLSICLFNDLSPNPWTASGALRLEHLKNKPQSFPFFQHLDPSLIDKRQLLQDFQEKVWQQFQDFSQRYVSKLRYDSSNNNWEIFFNAPFEKLICGKILRAPHLATHNNRAVAYWKTFHCELDSVLLAALPTVSFWANPCRETLVGERFLNSGLITDEAIFRVFSIASKKDQTKKELIIQKIRLNKKAPHRNSIPLKLDEKRPDRFLWDLIPQLESQDLKFGVVSNCEDYLYNHIDSVCESESSQYKVSYKNLLKEEQISERLDQYLCLR